MSKKNKYQNIADEECKQAVIFARVSSEEQKKGASINAQIKTVSDYCESLLNLFFTMFFLLNGLRFYDIL